MLGFEEFLAETKWDKYLYHATYKDFDPKNISAHSHLGTLQSAMHRAEYGKNPNLNQGREQLKIHAYKHTPSGKPFITSDKKTDKMADPGTEYSHTQYPNAIERKGSRSTIVHEPKDLEHVHTFNAPKYIDRFKEWGKAPHREPIKRRRIGSIVKEK